MKNQSNVCCPECSPGIWGVCKNPQCSCHHPSNQYTALSKEQELTVESVVKEFEYEFKNDFLIGDYDSWDNEKILPWLRSTLQQFEKQRFEAGKKEGERHADWLGETLLDARKSGALAALSDVEKEVSALITEEVHGYLTAQPVRAPSHEATKRIALREVLEKVISLKEKYTSKK
jgi:hypothetical protein